MKRLCSIPAVVAALALCLAAGFGCGPDFPAFWLIQADPVAASGEIDPAGKLRVLSLRADPPEGAPGQTVALQSLVVIHPQAGQVVLEDGVMVHTPRPVGLSALWFVCREPETQVSPQPCGLGPAGTWSDMVPLVTGYADDGPTAELAIPPLSPDEKLPASRIVTLIVADAALSGGAQACFAAARQDQGVVPDANHCLIAVKRVTVSQSAQPNRNPAIARLWFGGSVDTLQDLALAPGRYPLLDPAMADDDRPKFVFGVERAADAAQTGFDEEGSAHAETLNATVFVTGGTLEAGRDSFLDIDCQDVPQNCPQIARADSNWQPPAARATLEAPEQRIYFFAVLRDDRGGQSVMRATVTGFAGAGIHR